MKVLPVSSTRKLRQIPAKKSGKVFSSMQWIVLFTCSVSTIFVFLAGCAPPFSAMQSARLAGKGKFEVTPIFSTVFFSAEGETEHVQNDFGLQGAYGLADRFDLQLRYEFISVEIEDASASANVIGIGPKIGIYKDVIAMSLPIGFAFGGDIEDISETWQFHPTFLFTLSVGNSFEFNPSTKMLIPISGDGDVLLAFNLGAGISANLKKWVVRPEVGFLINPGEEGRFTHLSIGLTIYP